MAFCWPAPLCGHERVHDADPSEDEDDADIVIREAVGNALADGDTVVVVKKSD